MSGQHSIHSELVDHNVVAVNSTEMIEGIPADRLPGHVAIIMDGNNRWAKRNRLKTIASGHKEGVRTVRRIIECCRNYRIEVLSLFAFSSENWQRPRAEVSALMEIFLLALRNEAKKLHKHGIRLKVIGDITAFSEAIQRSIVKAEELTANNTEVTLLVAANYGGRWDIAQAVRKLAQEVKNGQLEPEEIDENLIQANLSTADIPPPDLMIRTSGEFRISNFMLWQSAYTELYFTDTLWPDFDHKDFHKAMLAYASRERRFGQAGR